MALSPPADTLRTPLSPIGPRSLASRTAWAAPAVMAILAVLAFAVRAYHGLHSAPFGDESGHFLGARAIVAGDRLYRDFIDAHGPLSFMVAQLYIVLFGGTEPLQARWAIIAIIAAAAAAITTSPALHDSRARLWALALFLGLITGPWIIQALNMLNFYTIGGALVAVVLAWLVLPAWQNDPIIRWQAVASGVCLALLCAAAYSFVPTALLLAASAALAIYVGPNRASFRELMVAQAVGALAGLFLILAWMLRYGDPVGYLVFHIINMQVNYSRYIPFGWKVMLASLVPSTRAAYIVQTTATLAFAAGFAALFSRPRQWQTLRHPVIRAAALLLWVLAILLLNIRGSNLFHNGGFLVASMAMAALALPIALANGARPPTTVSTLPVSLALGLLLTANELTDRRALATPSGVPAEEFRKWPQGTLKTDDAIPIVHRIRQVLRPGERLLVLEYHPNLYLLAGFLSFRKYHEYLPWEADYARAPWFGRQRDLCVDLARDPPPVIVYTHEKVWGKYDTESFMPCLSPLLAKDYQADAIATLFIRKDRVPSP